MRSTETASSKSLALSPSMVTNLLFLRSTLSLVSSCDTSWWVFSAAAATSAGNVRERPCFLTMISISTSGSSWRPTISRTRPDGDLKASGHFVTSTSTMSPCWAPFAPLGVIITLWSTRSSEGITTAKPFPFSNFPTITPCLLSRIRRTFPSRLPSLFVCSTRATTLSRCMAPFIPLGLINRSSPSPSGRTKPNPFG